MTEVSEHLHTVWSVQSLCFVYFWTQSCEMISRLARCLMVGLPWGQFHGCSISPMWITSFFISPTLRAVPIITWRQIPAETNNQVFEKILRHKITTIKTLSTVYMLLDNSTKWWSDKRILQFRLLLTYYQSIFLSTA